MTSCQCNYCGVGFTPPLATACATSWHEQLKISGRMQNDCPGCGATVQERQLKFYFDNMKLLQGRSNMRILHFNPELRWLNYLAKFQPELHILAMTDAPDRRYETVNIEVIPYDDGVFDLVIANSQLEAVESVDQTLNELNRIVKPDGLVVLQTSFSHVLESTWEDSGLNSEDLRAHAYGHKHHRRLFGLDMLQRVSEKLNSNVLQFFQLAGLDNPHALDVRDPFMLFRKRVSDDRASDLHLQRCKDDGVAVSILCITYNHEAFIEKTLASFLEQKTNFPFEIVIGEDGSTDDTLAILRVWAARYPNLIKLLSGQPNMGAHLNWERAYSACTGRYIAMCEGDDRWTDPLKLQKQFDYLETHPDCVMTYGSVQAHKENWIDYSYSGGAKVDLPAAVLQHAPPINSMTVMFRNILGAMPPEKLACGAGDMFIWSLLGQHGYGHYMPSILPSVYNLHAGGTHSLTGAANQHRLRLKTFYAAYHYYARCGRPDLAEYFLQGVAKDAVHIAHISTPVQAQTLLGSVVPEVSHAMRHVQHFDMATLKSIIDHVLSQQECSDVH